MIMSLLSSNLTKSSTWSNHGPKHYRLRNPGLDVQRFPCHRLYPKP